MNYYPYYDSYNTNERALGYLLPMRRPYPYYNNLYPTLPRLYQRPTYLRYNPYYPLLYR